MDQSLSDLECSVKHSDKDSMDLKSAKSALDQHKVKSIFSSNSSLRYPHPTPPLILGEFCLPIWQMIFFAGVIASYVNCTSSI